MSISSEIAKEMQVLFPDDCKIVKIKLLHTRAVRKYVMGIEKAHRKAAHSKLSFGG